MRHLLLTTTTGPIMKSTSVVVGLLVGCIIAACTNYFDNTGINAVSLFHQLLGLLNGGGYFLVA